MIFGLTAGCSLIGGGQPPIDEPCRLPSRPDIASKNIQGINIKGDTWVAYHPDSHKRLMVYITELENAATQCGGIR